MRALWRSPGTFAHKKIGTEDKVKLVDGKRKEARTKNDLCGEIMGGLYAFAFGGHEG